MTTDPSSQSPAPPPDAELRQLTAKRAPILHQLSEGLIIAGVDGRLLFVNEAAERLHGVKQLDVAPDDYSETYSLFTMEGAPYPFEELPLTRAVAGETVADARWRIRRPDGSEVIALGSARPLMRNGQQFGAILNLRDDSDRFVAEQRLRESEERLRLVIDSASDYAILTTDPDRMVTSWSRGAELAFGYSASEIVGRSGDLLWTPEDRADQAPQREVATARAEGCANDERWHLRKDGSRVFMNGSVHPLPRNEDGSERGFIKIAQDETERRAIEDALRQRTTQFENLFDDSPLGIYLLDSTFRIRQVNPVARQVLADIPNIEGRDFVETVCSLWEKDFADAIIALFRRTLNTGIPYFCDEPIERHFDDGPTRFYEWQINRIVLPEGGHGIACYFRDVSAAVRDRASIAESEARYRQLADALADLNETLELRVKQEIAQRAEAEEALRQSQKMETLGQLTGGIAHDFNNLLQIITGNLDILRRTLPTDSPRQQRAVDHAFRGAERAAVLTQRLLAFSRRQPLAPKNIDPNKLVAGMSELLYRTIGEEIAIETVHASGLWRVEVDPNQLENAILNLAVNSRDAMAAGGKLTIETANTYLDHDYAARHQGVVAGQYVVICVSDTGSGMDAATAERAVDPFFTTKEVGKGTGLGLSMVYGFVKQSGGHFKIYSEPGEGTTVKIYLPRHYGEEVEAEAWTGISVEPASAPGSVHGETILVCEDDADVRAFSANSLRSLGYRVVEAADGPSALRLIEDAAGGIALLFTDVVLPGGMTGAEVAERARAIDPGLKVLFTTGYARNAIVHHGRLDPGVELLSKPFSFSDLAARVSEMLGVAGAPAQLPAGAPGPTRTDTP